MEEVACIRISVGVSEANSVNGSEGVFVPGARLVQAERRLSFEPELCVSPQSITLETIVNEQGHLTDRARVHAFSG